MWEKLYKNSIIVSHATHQNTWIKSKLLMWHLVWKIYYPRILNASTSNKQRYNLTNTYALKVLLKVVIQEWFINKHIYYIKLMDFVYGYYIFT